ncbi:MORN repeat containing [Tritrichomonas foetus]|uniref:MORN repeat-containing protein 3 n=1 Tax=Tritrichomonas foetus TaxID=1144522 RepID=A0A1J4JR10_9EUKA|nr:MORN repeat containing [Tritrichomonas foetus]|eukprot:OHT01186.1 MORN repeat containing [Tritrichomonas foetus]
MSEYDSREQQQYYEEEDVRSVSNASADFFGEIFSAGDGVTPKVLQDRIKKRKPNPGCYLTSKKFANIRFGERCTRGITVRAKWHDVDDKANKNGMRQLIVLDDGTEYVGEWLNNLRHGTGRHFTAEGYYDGQFVEDLYEGKGEYYLWSEETNCNQPGVWLLYSGEWLAGKFSGVGVKYEQNKDTYEGEFLKGKRCGQGKMYYANQDLYEGEWENDLRNGHGQLIKANGDRFDGIYKDDKRNGEGELHILATKRRLEGVWVDDMMKCGSYYDEQEDPVYVQPDDITGTTDGMIPKLELQDPEGVLNQVKSTL